MADGLTQAAGNTVRFQRMAAIELRRIAERSTDVADELRHIADQLDADACDLESASRPRSGS